MKTKSRSIEHLIEQQIQRWKIMQPEEEKEEESVHVITVSREPGSGGSLVGKMVAEHLGMDFFHREIIQKIAESANISKSLLETLDEKGLSLLDDWASTLVNKRHLWPDQYLQHLIRVVGAISRHGHAVIVGRGANFLLPPEKVLRVRVVAPLDLRVKNVATDFGASVEEAKRHVMRTESERSAFVRKYFHADIDAPVNYDLVINTGTLTIEGAAEAIKAALKGKKR